MRDLGKHRYHPGDVIGRWTVIRHSTPVQRPHGQGRMVNRHRVLARCVCGATEIVIERQLAKGHSRGCTSKTCWNAYRDRERIARWQAIREHAVEMRRLADEAEAAAMDAEIRIREAQERLEAAEANLAARTWRNR